MSGLQGTTAVSPAPPQGIGRAIAQTFGGGRRQFFITAEIVERLQGLAPVNRTAGERRASERSTCTTTTGSGIHRRAADQTGRARRHVNARRRDHPATSSTGTGLTGGQCSRSCHFGGAGGQSGRRQGHASHPSRGHNRDDLLIRGVATAPGLWRDKAPFEFPVH